MVSHPGIHLHKIVIVIVICYSMLCYRYHYCDRQVSVEPLSCICCCFVRFIVYIVFAYTVHLLEYISAHNDFLLIGDRSRQARQGTQTLVASTSSKVERT